MNKINFENLPSTRTPINASNLNQLQDNIEDAFKAKVLWENQTLRSFNPQTINLSSNDYDFLIIYIFRNPTLDLKTLTTRIEKNKQGEILYTDYFSNEVRVFSRVATVGTNTITFDDCFINGTANNAILIPYKIVGCKYN